MAESDNNSIDFSIDRSNLYKEESFTDLKVGNIRRLIPVKPDGSEDKTRKAIFVGQTNLMTPNGPLPIQGVIKAKELQQAVKRFPETMEEAVERLMEEAQKMKDQQESKIITKQKEDSRIIIPGR
ncbi:MAG TPA: cytoplasmic protein [Deltaproteobacteria bacterium]|nr:cytoplasmic protein [Deltaproteobacteria bacterium]